MKNKKPTKKEMLTKKLNRAMALQGLVFLISNLSLMGSPSKKTSSGVAGQRYDPRDGGIHEQTINEKGEVIRTIRRDPNSDISVIVERGADKRIQYKHIKMPLNYENGFYEIKEGVPITLKSKSK